LGEEVNFLYKKVSFSVFVLQLKQNKNKNMRKISDVLSEIILQNPILEFGTSYELFNLTQLAKFLKPMVEARSQKGVQTSALVMNLSRWKKQHRHHSILKQQFVLKNISIYTEICTWTFAASPRTTQEIQKCYQKIQSQNGFFSIAETSHEITVCVEKKFETLISSTISESSKYENLELSCLDVLFDDQFTTVPGLLFTLLQKLAFQNINIIEIASTYTGLSFYLNKKDARLAFETLHDSFMI
jgi:aspartokinase